MWFAAVKTTETNLSATQLDKVIQFADNVEVPWSVSAELAFIGGNIDPYWDSMMLLGSHTDLDQVITFNEKLIDDAYLVRLEPYQVPAWGLSLYSIYSALHRYGILGNKLKAPTQAVDTSLIREDIGPNQKSIKALFQLPKNKKPMMVNFVKFYDYAQYQNNKRPENTDLTGRQAYDIYGEIANKTIYGLGGEYVLGGYIVEELRAAKNGLTIGEWDDIAVMQYPQPTTILMMDQIDEYQQSLYHRNAGLKHTVIITGFAK